MKRHLNNKGYLLVEIILASVLAMLIAYFMTDLTLKLKNKNDDLLVKTLVSTDQAIIYNTIMKDLYANSDDIDCNYIDNKLTIDGNVFKYGDFTNVVSEYASLGNDSLKKYNCSDDDGVVIFIPLKVEQLPDYNFSINIGYKDGNFAYNMPSCTLTVSGSKINATIVENGSGLVYSGWNSNMNDGNGATSKNISTGTHTYYLKDSSNNVGNCSVVIKKSTKKEEIDTVDAKFVGEQTDGCTCRSPGGSGYTFGVCDEDGVCDCASLTIRTDRCYKCSQSDYTLNKTTCSKVIKTTYSCSSGYNKVKNNNSYCYKIN